MRQPPADTHSPRYEESPAFSPAEASLLRELTVPHGCRAGDLLFTEGSPAPGFYLLRHGRMKLFHTDRSGRTFTIGVCEPVALIGELSARDARPQAVSAEALTDCDLQFVPRQHLARLIDASPAFALRLAEMLSEQLSSARRAARDLALRRAEERLAALLLQTLEARTRNGIPSRNDSSRRPLRLSRRDLAERLGVSTETAIRLLSSLRRKGIVDIVCRDITVRSLERLRALAEPELDAPDAHQVGLIA